MITSIGLTLICLALVAALVFQQKWAREERSELEDRIMALSKPEAFITHKAAQDPEPAVVSYVDEGREVQLQDTEHDRNGHVELLGDD